MSGNVNREWADVIHRHKHTHCKVCGKMLRDNVNAYASIVGEDGWESDYCVDHAGPALDELSARQGLCSEGERVAWAGA